MVKTKLLTTLVEPELYERIKRKSEETGVPYSEVIRRALEAWVVTGELAIVPKQSKHKREDKSSE